MSAKKTRHSNSSNSSNHFTSSRASVVLDPPPPDPAKKLAKERDDDVAAKALLRGIGWLVEDDFAALCRLLTEKSIQLPKAGLDRESFVVWAADLRTKRKNDYDILVDLLRGVMAKRIEENLR